MTFLIEKRLINLQIIDHGGKDLAEDGQGLWSMQQARDDAGALRL